jgi:FdhD protein
MTTLTIPPVTPTPLIAWRDHPRAETRALPTETPIALTYHRQTHAVMLASPADLEDFAIGFSLNEGLIESPADIEALDIVQVPDGIELRMDLVDRAEARFITRRRSLAGPSGCGLCGLDSLADATRPPPRVTAATRFTPQQVIAAIASLPDAQPLNRQTHAVHAAGFHVPGQGLLAAREDIGRHNALDKLTGALARAGHEAGHGILVLTSRVSVELIQKAARLGAPVLVAISAPTTLAVATADACNLTLVAIARRAEFEVFTHPGRIETV